jgi:hypothetical protein
MTGIPAASIFLTQSSVPLDSPSLGFQAKVPGSPMEGTIDPTIAHMAGTVHHDDRILADRLETRQDRLSKGIAIPVAGSGNENPESHQGHL